MQLHQLEYFVAVAEEGSFTRGAQRARIVQSAASAAVARLEQEFGVKLFIRTGRRITLTEAGRSLLTHARRMLAGAQAAREQLGALAQGITGSIVVGTLLSTGTVDLTAALCAFRTRHPAVSVRLRHSLGHSADHLIAVRDGSADLALVIIPPRPPDGVRIEPIGSLRLALACSPDHRLARRRQVRYRDLAGETFIDFPQGWGNRDAVDEIFRTTGVQRTVAIEVTDMASALELAAGGLGVAFVPEAVLDGRHDVATVELAHPRKHSPIGLASARRLPLSAAAQALRRLLLEQNDQAVLGG
jgi:DNA-binding transcriptional LysR family regulator